MPIHIQADATAQKKDGSTTKTVEVITVDKMKQVGFHMLPL